MIADDAICSIGSAIWAFPALRQREHSISSLVSFANAILNEQKLAVVPGSAFGNSGEGFLRISYAYSLEDLQKAMERLEKFIETRQSK